MTGQHPQPGHEPAADDVAPRVEMPAWMREHTRRTAAGRAEPLPRDDRAALAARIAQLPLHIADTAAAAGEEHRAQLTRWHTDDHTAHDEDGTDGTR